MASLHPSTDKLRLSADPSPPSGLGNVRHGWMPLLRGAGLAVLAAGLAVLEEFLRDEAGVLADRLLDRVRDPRIVLEELLGVLAPLPQPLAVIGEPGAALLDDAGLDAEVDEFAGLGDALAVHDVELDLLERWRELVLDHLDPRLVADHLVALLDGADAADVEADRGVELQRVATAGRLGVAEH